MSGLAPFKSCRARFTAIITSSKRLELSSKQSSTVIRAIRNDIPRGHSTQETSCSLESALKDPGGRCECGGLICPACLACRGINNETDKGVAPVCSKQRIRQIRKL